MSAADDAFRSSLGGVANCPMGRGKALRFATSRLASLPFGPEWVCRFSSPEMKKEKARRRRLGPVARWILIGSVISCSQPRPSGPARELPKTQLVGTSRGDPRPQSLEGERASPGETRAKITESVKCPESNEIEERPPREKFSAHGYAARTLSVDHGKQVQCVVVAWPKGSESNDGKPSRVAQHIHGAWFTAIENTLRRVPAHHAATLQRVIIDNHPTRHGIAAFDREDGTDGRDGRTIWLSEHLFLDENHWERGVRGEYFAYHASVDGLAIHDLPARHDVFSPVLLHELGHLVMYHIIQPRTDSLSPPPCARTCSDEGTCETISIEAREKPCISPYCRPFKYLASTENWAEQYRFFYQSSLTRDLLARAARSTQNCLRILESHDRTGEERGAAPWLRGLPDLDEFHPSRWESCGGRACKAW